MNKEGTFFDNNFDDLSTVEACWSPDLSMKTGRSGDIGSCHPDLSDKPSHCKFTNPIESTISTDTIHSTETTLASRTASSTESSISLEAAQIPNNGSANIPVIMNESEKARLSQVIGLKNPYHFQIEKQDIQRYVQNFEQCNFNYIDKGTVIELEHGEDVCDLLCRARNGGNPVLSSNISTTDVTAAQAHSTTIRGKLLSEGSEGDESHSLNQSENLDRLGMRTNMTSFLRGLGPLAQMAENSGGPEPLANLAGNSGGFGQLANLTGNSDGLGLLVNLAGNSGGLGPLANLTRNSSELGPLANMAENSGGIGPMANLAGNSDGLQPLANLPGNSVGLGSLPISFDGSLFAASSTRQQERASQISCDARNTFPPATRPKQTARTVRFKEQEAQRKNTNDQKLCVNPLQEGMVFDNNFDELSTVEAYWSPDLSMRTGRPGDVGSCHPDLSDEPSHCKFSNPTESTIFKETIYSTEATLASRTASSTESSISLEAAQIHDNGSANIPVMMNESEKARLSRVIGLKNPYHFQIEKKDMERYVQDIKQCNFNDLDEGTAFVLEDEEDICDVLCRARNGGKPVLSSNISTTDVTAAQAHSTTIRGRLLSEDSEGDESHPLNQSENIDRLGMRADITSYLRGLGPLAQMAGNSGGLWPLAIMAENSGGLGPLANLAGNSSGLGPLANLTGNSGGLGLLANLDRNSDGLGPLANMAGNSDGLGPRANLAGNSGGLGPLANLAGSSGGLGPLADMAENSSGLGPLTQMAGNSGGLAILSNLAGNSFGLEPLANLAGISHGLGPLANLAGISDGLDPPANLAGMSDGLGLLAYLAGISDGLVPLANLAGISDSIGPLAHLAGISEAERNGNFNSTEDCDLEQLVDIETQRAYMDRSPKSIGMNTLIILDTSGSMAGQPLIDALNFITDFINGLEEIQYKDNLRENVALAIFGKEIRVVQQLTSDYTLINQVIAELHAEGSSPVHYGLALTNCVMASQIYKDYKVTGLCVINDHVIPPRVILITDGHISTTDDSLGTEASPGIVNFQLKTECFILHSLSKAMTLNQMFCIPVGKTDEDLPIYTGSKLMSSKDGRKMSRLFLYHTIAADLKRRLDISDPNVIDRRVREVLTCCDDEDVARVQEIILQEEIDLTKANDILNRMLDQSSLDTIDASVFLRHTFKEYEVGALHKPGLSTPVGPFAD